MPAPGSTTLDLSSIPNCYRDWAVTGTAYTCQSTASKGNNAAWEEEDSDDRPFGGGGGGRNIPLFYKP